MRSFRVALTALPDTEEWRGPLLLRGASGDVLLSGRLAAALGAASGELAVLTYLSRNQTTPEGWVDVDRRELAALAGTSPANIRRALSRLSRLGLVEQKRPRSSLWRIRPEVVRAEDPAPERREPTATR